MTPTFEALIERDRVYSLYRQGLLTSLTALIIGTLVFSLLWQSLPQVWLWTWFAAFLANQVVRILLWRGFHLEKPEGERVAVWAHRYTLCVAAWGVLLGGTAAVMLPFAEPLGQVFLMILIASTGAGGVIAYVSHRPAMFAYLFPTLIPMGVSLIYMAAIRQTFDYCLLSVAYVLAVVVLIGWGRIQAEVLRKSIEFGHRNAELVVELREKTAIAEQASLAKSKFFAAASHDLRQPLQALGLFAASMHGAGKDADEERRTGRILASVDALESLFDELLDISKLDAGYVVPVPAHFSAREMFARMGAVYAPLAEEAGLDLKFDASGAVLHSDPVLLERIVGNLVSNAIRYTPAGTVAVRCVSRRDRVAIEVSDTGVGIPLSEHDKVFDEFYQLGNPERDRKKGLGLGLATVRRMSALLGCPVTLRSEPGHGSVFTVDVPAGDPAKAVPVATEAVITGADLLRGKVVAVLDDEREVREGLVEFLTQCQCTVVDAGSAAELLGKLEAAGLAPDVMLSDFRLRDHETGTDAIAAVRARYGAGLPALLMSGDTSAQVFALARAANLALLSKPVRPVRLRAGLQNALREGGGISLNGNKTPLMTATALENSI